MIHPSTEVRFISAEIGYGVVATSLIPRGSVTWVYDRLDREYTREQIDSFDRVHRDILLQYSFRNSSGNLVFCWDHTRFMNHSFRPNCLPTAYNLEIAIRDIEPGEEMTNDYGCFNLLEPFTPLGDTDPLGRKEVRPDDLLRYSEVWDREIQSALFCLPQVEQPLAPFLGSEVWDVLVAVASGVDSLRSIEELHFSDKRVGIGTEIGN